MLAFEKSKFIVRMELLSPVPFYKMPLAYENTFCGTDDSKIRNSVPASFPENPLGTGFVVKKRISKGKGKPACFGPIPGNWAPRVYYSGTYDETWLNEKSPLLPGDFDERFFFALPKTSRFQAI